MSENSGKKETSGKNCEKCNVLIENTLRCHYRKTFTTPNGVEKQEAGTPKKRQPPELAIRLLRQSRFVQLQCFISK
jgi:hypothetical protein